MTIAESVSVISLVVSLVALYFAAIKEAYLVRLEHRRVNSSFKSYLSVVNNSKFPIDISAFGYVNENEEFYWLEGFGCARNGKKASLPVAVNARASFEASIADSYVKEFDTNKFGLVVQLVCGRTYFVNYGLPYQLAIRYLVKCKLSQYTGGIIGFEKNYVHARPYED
ncbi:hypothetical protein HWQ46_25790 [Shewanella sp. D64]|uniref:hypothetical protein n=1 Tax=unclassified Shewanella TaxID=196818 RepID=UPI0022BA6733|nr:MULTISPECIES: hypothetical protein [unclassified Shewanella]MEC4728930.1 hypothetical protein [Shewanella sp. D64]MEC4740863.1 hypothetical protein [Shewanella sp. E94]WBJ96704.1 hypothetical protein HWQ47_06205 [Shewanella sp. MTB7]